MERTMHAQRVTEDELLAWVSAINDLRLILGTRLDVTQDMDLSGVESGDPRTPMFELYAYLTLLEGDAVTALSAAP